MLETIQVEIQALTCLNNKDKLEHMKHKKVGYNDILTLAKNRYLSQMTPTAIRWPAACNPRDSKAAPVNFGNLAQLPGPTAPPSAGRNGGNRDGRNGRNRDGRNGRNRRYQGRNQGRHQGRNKSRHQSRHQGRNQGAEASLQAKEPKLWVDLPHFDKDRI